MIKILQPLGHPPVTPSETIVSNDRFAPGGRRGRRIEPLEAVEVLGDVLVDLDHVVHVAHLVEHGRVVGVVLPLAIHNELVLRSGAGSMCVCV